MKKLTAVSLMISIIAVIFSACYTPPEPTVDSTFLVSPNAKVNGYWGRAIAVVGNYAFVGESFNDASRGGNTYNEAGQVMMLKLGASTEGIWGIARDTTTQEPIVFTSPDCAVGDQFGAEMYYYDDGVQRLLFVTALMADVNYSGSPMINTGAVYVYTVPADLSETSLPVFQAKVSLDGIADMDLFLPSAAPATKDVITKDKIVPGLGFGRTVRYDATHEVLVIGAPYESYYKDITESGNFVEVSKPGAVYVFQTDTPGDFTTWSLRNRLMPQINKPVYDVVQYLDAEGNEMGRTVSADPTSYDEDQYDDWANMKFGDVIDVQGDTIAIGAPSARFPYYQHKEASVPADGVYYDELGNPVAAPAEGTIARYDLRVATTGAVYVYRLTGASWDFQQRLDRKHHEEKFATVMPYFYDDADDVFYDIQYNEGENLGAAVIVYQDFILASVPSEDGGTTGNKKSNTISRTSNNTGVVSFYKRVDSGQSQYPVKDLSGPASFYWPDWGSTMVRRGEYLAISAPGEDWSILQPNVGVVTMYQFNADGSDFTEIAGESEFSVKELYKGYQGLGAYMDFSVESGQLICGVPGFSLPIYYNKPYIDYYALENCGAVYTFKWK